ncbi:MAG: hypothetical protein Q7J27_07805 [Syntrophales bacterium]|nr:hypothetical protein [Syntrophales bacterium]
MIVAVKEQIRRLKLKKLAGLLGTVEIDAKAINESNKAVHGLKLFEP